jgi:PhoPQ-activated pathogenicity-related protein
MLLCQSVRQLAAKSLRRCPPVFFIVFSATSLLHAGETALDRYVAKPDNTYSWKVVRKIQEGDATQYIVDLKSQTWRTTKDVDRPVWQHWLTIIKPDKPISTIPYLFITGGSNLDAPPGKLDPLMAMTAKATHGIICELKMVPNQPLVFHNDGHLRKEDDFIAYTWGQFLKGGDDEWPARLPMVKSAVRAMDCIQELLASDEGGNLKVEKFVVAGGSKRGWTTWCTAAVDKRVAAIVPSSIDCLNNALSMRHHVAVYGFYTLAVGDYYRQHIMQQTANPRMKLLHDIEDPYSYRDRLTMPKYIVNASGDQYFCPDSSQFYFDVLPGEKYLRYVPNVAHNLKGSDARESVAAFYYTVITGARRPKYSWTFEKDGSIRVKATDMTPKAVTLWQANNPKARDFRLMSIGKAYKPQALKAERDGTYVARIEKPEHGWTASFVELTYDVGAPFPFQVSTAVRITPDTLPHEDLDPTKAPSEARMRRGNPL